MKLKTKNYKNLIQCIQTKCNHYNLNITLKIVCCTVQVGEKAYLANHRDNILQNETGIINEIRITVFNYFLLTHHHEDSLYMQTYKY